MSQHYLASAYNGAAVTVILGWDRPIGHFLLVIEYADKEGECLYSNLNECHPFQKSLAYYKNKLDEFGIQVPDQMFSEVERDQALNTGKRYVWHAMDGTFREH